MNKDFRSYWCLNTQTVTKLLWRVYYCQSHLNPQFLLPMKSNRKQKASSALNRHPVRPRNRGGNCHVDTSNMKKLHGESPPYGNSVSPIMPVVKVCRPTWTPFGMACIRHLTCQAIRQFACLGIKYNPPIPQHKHWQSLEYRQYLISNVA